MGCTLARFDRLDAELLAALMGDGRLPVAELAERLGVSRNTAQQRLRRLEGDGVITGYAPQLDLKALGFGVEAVISVQIDQRRMRGIVEELRRIPGVLAARIQTGSEDLLLQGATRTLEDLQDLTAAIVEIDGVRGTTTTLSVATPIAFRTQLLLDELAEGRGWGRAEGSPRG
jgi:DNA-binding Lrp family transcriptional regulator